MVVTESKVEGEIVEILKDMTQDWDLEEVEEINSSTQLVADLSFASVDIIHMVVSIEEHFKQKLGFNELLMENGKYKEDLSIKELAKFVASKLKE